MFLKFFKEAEADFEFEQKNSSTLEEFLTVVKNSEKYTAVATKDSPAKQPPAAKQKFDQFSKDFGSNV